MNANKRARIATIVVLACVLGVVIVRRGRPKITPAAQDPTAQDAVYAMLEAAREGNVGKYLASYSGEMQTSLKQAIAEPADFSKYLKDSNAAIKGVAIREPEPVSANEVKARVEYVFQDRNEIQFIFLDKTAGGWKIVRVDSAERVKTLVPYGTPVR